MISCNQHIGLTTICQDLIRQKIGCEEPIFCHLPQGGRFLTFSFGEGGKARLKSSRALTDEEAMKQNEFCDQQDTVPTPVLNTSSGSASHLPQGGRCYLTFSFGEGGKSRLIMSRDLTDEETIILNGFAANKTQYRPPS